MSIFDRLFGQFSISRKSSGDGNRESREQIYMEAFGQIEAVSHELEARGTHVDVYRFAPCEGRPFYTYITGGMSEHKQPGMSGNPLARTELVFYSTEHNQLYAELLRNFAHYPFETGAAINGWDTIPLRSHAQQVIGSDRFRNLLFCAATRKEDLHLPGKLEVAGEPVYPMMVVPLTDPEFDLLQAEGVQMLLEKISRSDVSIIYDPARESVV